MDPATGAVIIAGLKYMGAPAAQTVNTFLSQILTPVATVTGDAIAHPIREFQRRRVENANSLLEAAASKLIAKGIDPQPVANRVLWPILEKGSLEEDDTLQTIWAQMLANAAAPTTSFSVLAAFPGILSELTPVEVQVLQHALVNCVQPDPRHSGSNVCLLRLTEIQQLFSLNLLMTMAIVGNLTRLGLIERDWESSLHKTLSGFDATATTEDEPQETLCRITIFGFAFLKSCTDIFELNVSL